MDKTITDNLRYAKIVIGDLYSSGYDVCLEIPAFFIIPGTENYKAFGLDVDRSQFESSLEFIRIVLQIKIEENHIRLHKEKQTEEFDLTDDNFKEKMIKFLLH